MKKEKIKLTYKQYAILNFLYQDIDDIRYYSPSIIGLKVGGKNYNLSSPWACKTLKTLLAKNLVVRTYRRCYAITPKGIKWLKYLNEKEEANEQMEISEKSGAV